MKILKVLLFCISFNYLYSVDVQHFKRTNSYGFEYAESAMLEDGLYTQDYTLLFNLGVSVVDDPLVAKTDDKKDRLDVLVKRFIPIHFGANMRLLSWLRIDLTGSYTQVLDRYREDKKLWSFEDTELAAIFRIMHSNKTAVAIAPFMIFPTGNEDVFLSSKSTGYGIRVLAEKDLYITQLVLNLGYRYAKEAKDIKSLDQRQRVNFTVGTYTKILPSLAANIEYRRHFFLPFKNKQLPNELYFGLRIQTRDDLAIHAGFSRGNVFDEDDSNNYRLSAGLKYVLIQKAVNRAPKSVCQARTIFRKENKKTIIYFSNDSAKLSSKELLKIKALVNRFKTEKTYENIKLSALNINAHTSKIGNAAYNLILSKKRSVSVFDRLRKYKPFRKIVHIVNHGESSPLIGDEKNVNDQAKNRRVEVEVVFEEIISTCK